MIDDKLTSKTMLTEFLPDLVNFIKKTPYTKFVYACKNSEEYLKLKESIKVLNLYYEISFLKTSFSDGKAILKAENNLELFQNNLIKYSKYLNFFYKYDYDYGLNDGLNNIFIIKNLILAMACYIIKVQIK